MASNQQSRSWWLVIFCAFCAFVAGILLGRYLIPHKPTFAFNILPGGVLAAPRAGEVLEWYKDGQLSDDVHIHFYGESPCAEGDDGHKCTITKEAEHKGQFLYFCSDKADPSDPSAKILCLDPGNDPGSGGGGTGKPPGKGKLQLPGENNVVYAAQLSKSPEPRSPEPSEPAPAVQIAPTNLTVVCKNNTVQILNPSTTPPNTATPNVKVGGLVQWNSTLDPIITMDPNYCAAASTGDNPPTCTVKSAGDISYTVKVDKCSNGTPATFHINVRNLLKGCDF